MSSLLFATPKEMTDWLASLASGRRVLAPRCEGPVVVYRPCSAEHLKEAGVGALLKRSTASPKAAMLPQCETLVKFHSDKDADDPAKLSTVLEAPVEAEPTVLFGCRPCDARGFVVLDRPYLEGPLKDPYYGARREATVVVTQACPSASASCFCNWVGGSPSSTEGSDILFTAVGDGYVLEAVTDRGAALLDGAGFAGAAEKAAEAESVHAAAMAALPAAPALSEAAGKVAARFTDDEFWKRETAGCLSCGACTYLCPTCQCFTITDLGSQLDGKRLRSWDSCMTPLFTLETSGHNARALKHQRWRNRLSHKFSFYPERYNGFFSCVGCGRCVENCPSSIDIRSMLLDAMGVTAAESDEVKDSPAPAPAAPAPAAPASTGAVAGEGGSPAASPKPASAGSRKAAPRGKSRKK